MRYAAVITLIAVTYAADTIGQETETRTTRDVLANEYSVSSSEFYDAGRSGMRPERQYQVRSDDYDGERLMTVEGVEYNIIRTERRGDFTRLVCERVAGNG